MLPNSVASAILLAVLVLPGLIFEGRRERHRPAITRTTFRELTNIVTASVVLGFVSLVVIAGVVKATSWPSSRWIVNLGAWSNDHGYIAGHTRAVLVSIAAHAGLATLVGLVADWAWEASRAWRTTRRDVRAKKRVDHGKPPRPVPSTSPHSVWWTAIYGQGRPAKDSETVLTFYLKSGKVMAGHLAGVTVGDEADRDFLLRDYPAFPVTVWDAKGASIALTSTERQLVVVPANEVEYSTIGFRAPSGPVAGGAENGTTSRLSRWRPCQRSRRSRPSG